MIEGDFQYQSGIVQAEEKGLRIGIYRKAIVGLRFGDAGGCLGRCMFNGARLVSSLDDVIRFFEPFLYIAKAHPAALVPLVNKIVLAPVGHDGCIRRQGLLHVKNCRKLFQINFDFGHGFKRRFFLVPVYPIVAFEKFLCWLPRGLRGKFLRFKLTRRLLKGVLGVRLVGVKA